MVHRWHRYPYGLPVTRLPRPGNAHLDRPLRGGRLLPGPPQRVLPRRRRARRALVQGDPAPRHPPAERRAADVSQRDPRGHWLLLTLGGLALAGLLLLDGYAHGTVGESPQQPSSDP